MPLSVTPIDSRVYLVFPSLSNQHVLNSGIIQIKKDGNFSGRRTAVFKMSRRFGLVTNSVSEDSSASVELNVPFPSDYSELLEQAKEATKIALKDKRQLMEIEFPTAGLESVPGDGEGGIEMTGSIQLIREFCDLFIIPEKATRTRISVFAGAPPIVLEERRRRQLLRARNTIGSNGRPRGEAKEVEFARKSAFGGASFKLDYLTKPSIFEDFGFVSKVKMVDRVKPDDELFLVAYPYYNVNEMLVVEELYKEAVENTARKLIIFNGELDRIRSGYYPSFFYPKLAALSKTLLPKMETVYYIHNFKGRNGGVLFRCYPGPWKVLRKVRNKYTCLHQQDLMPSLKEVALNILPSA